MRYSLAAVPGRCARTAALILICVAQLQELQATPALAQGASQRPAPAARPQSPAGVTAFVGVAVIPMDSERVLRDQTVLVRDGRIAALGPTTAVEVPAGATRIAAAGKYLLPGLADMHTHLAVTDEGGLDARSQLLSYLAVGVTTLRNMRGEPGHVALRDSIARGEVLGPRLYTAGPYPDSQDVASPDAAARFVADQRAAGYDFIKIHRSDFTPEVLDTITAVAARAGMRVATDLGVDVQAPLVSVEQQLQAHVGSIEHMSQYILMPGGLQPPDIPDEARMRALAEATRRAGTWIVPTEAILYGALARYLAMPRQDSTQRATFAAEYPIFRRQLTARRQLIKAFQDAGVGLLLGTDNLAGGTDSTSMLPGGHFEWVPRELDLLVQAGLTPYQALLTGTRNVAQFLGTLDSTGTFAVGKRADLLLLNGNPLEDIRHAADVAGVVVGGRWLPPEALKVKAKSP